MQLLSKLSVILVIALVQACATSPGGRMQLKLMSTDKMDALGAQSFEQMKQDVAISSNPAAIDYVNCIASRIIPQLAENNDPASWEVVVFADEQANAFALPGNKIGVYEGLFEYAVNQHQVAAVIGHEVAHVIAEHGNERVSQQVASQVGLSIASVVIGADSENDSLILAGLGLGITYGVILPFSRSHESEADIIGLDLMAKAGFDPAESIPLWQNMAKSGASQPEFMSTHPSSKTRIEDLSARMDVARKLQASAHASGKVPNCKI